MNNRIANDLIRYAELVEDGALISPEEMNCASVMRLAAEYLAQPASYKQSTTCGEPVAWESILGAIARGWCYEENANKTIDKDLAEAIAKEVYALYTTPPTQQGCSQRTAAEGEDTRRAWAGLTDEDKKEYVSQDFGGNRLDAMDWAEKRLKEKNTRNGGCS